MTTIAYNHKDKEIAIDSRDTAGGCVMSDKASKVIVVDDVTFFPCGAVSEIERLIKAFIDGSTEKRVIDANAIVMCSRSVFKIGSDEDFGLWENKLDYSFANGSGWTWAMAAMDFGKSAKDAVKYAMTRDFYTGGKIKVIKVK